MVCRFAARGANGVDGGRRAAFDLAASVLCHEFSAAAGEGCAGGGREGVISFDLAAFDAAFGEEIDGPDMALQGNGLTRTKQHNHQGCCEGAKSRYMNSVHHIYLPSPAVLDTDQLTSMRDFGFLIGSNTVI